MKSDFELFKNLPLMNEYKDNYKKSSDLQNRQI